MISIRITDYGTMIWQQDSKWHRAIGPAIVWSDGDQVWWPKDPGLFGQIAWSDGDRAWYNQGQLHRTDGPARILEDGQVEYWINGKQVSEYEVMFLNERCV